MPPISTCRYTSVATTRKLMQSIHGEAVDAPVRQISELFLAVHNVGGASFEDFLWWAARYPVVMLPMFRVQKVLRRMSLGETFFSAKASQGRLSAEEQTVRCASCASVGARRERLLTSTPIYVRPRNNWHRYTGCVAWLFMAGLGAHHRHDHARCRGVALCEEYARGLGVDGK